MSRPHLQCGCVVHLHSKQSILVKNEDESQTVITKKGLFVEHQTLKQLAVMFDQKGYVSICVQLDNFLQR